MTDAVKAWEWLSTRPHRSIDFTENMWVLWSTVEAGGKSYEAITPLDAVLMAMEGEGQ